MLKMIEPVWGQNLLKILNTYMAECDFLFNYMPVLADIFVFSYPIYLIALYVYGIVKQKKSYKEFALLLFFAGFLSMLVNVVIQFFVEKVRPDVVLELLAETRDSLFLEHLPKDTFPSDHAAMSAAIAAVTLFWGISHKNKFIKYLSIVFFVFALIMGYARISIGVHWPSDIVAGTLVGIGVGFICTREKVFGFVSKYLFSWVIILQEWIIKLIIRK